MIHLKLMNIQAILKAPKSQRNKFGNYNYRNCEDILEAVKPLLAKEGLILTLKDTIEYIGNRFYIQAMAILTCIESKETIITTAYAREEETKKGMDGSQITGASSSYARKYALNGLFCIDDTKDSDTTNTTTKETSTKEATTLTEPQMKRAYAIARANNLSDDAIKKWIKGKYHKDSLKDLTKSEYEELISALEKAKEK